MYDFEEAKREYRQLCKTEPSINLYMQAWYLDAACTNEENWKVILVKENDVVIAAFPFEYVKIKGLWRIKNPQACHYMGIWIREEKYKSQEHRLKRLTYIVDTILSLLPYYDKFYIVFQSSFKNWQPFYWKGFQAKVHYTMTISPDSVLEECIGKDRRKRIRKAQKEYVIKRNHMTIDEYWDFFEKSYIERNRTISYSKENFYRIISAAMAEEAITIRGVYMNDELVAEDIILKDKLRNYHEYGTQKANSHTSANSLAIYDAIQETVEEGKIFDFEGSMIKGVCEFNSSFGVKWEPYFIISKESRKSIIFNSLKSLINAIKGQKK